MHTLLNKNYFELFDLPTIFNIELLKLKKKYLQLQSKFHPDKLLNETLDLESEIKSIEISAKINLAFTTLNNAAMRAIYWCNLHNINTNVQAHIHIIQNIMNWHEDLEENLMHKHK